MRKSFVPFTGLAFLALFAVPASQSEAGPQAVLRPAEVLQPVIDVKLKCGITDDGTFVCKNVKKHHDDDDSGSNEDSHSGDKKSKKGNICKGPNDCGPGYRDLKHPNEYGACCEERLPKKPKDDPTPSSDEPKSQSKSNKCEGVNDCGPGYRDLETPSQYGSCCEEINDEPKTEPKPQEPDAPKSGKCQQVAQMNELSCSAPFDNFSCGALENGVMTCCCVK